MTALLHAALQAEPALHYDAQEQQTELLMYTSHNETRVMTGGLTCTALTVPERHLQHCYQSG